MIRRPSGPVWQLVPAVAFYACFFAVPVLILFAYSFWSVRGFQIVPGFTLDNYVTAISSTLYRTVFVRTVVVGMATALVVVPIAYVLAYLMRFVFDRRGQVLLDIILISLFSGYLVRIYSWRTILGREGLLNAALRQLGVIDEPLTFLVYSNLAVIITLAGMLIPLAVLPIHSSMSNVTREHLEGAEDLGAKGLRLHRTILVPMVLPGLSTAFAIAFILAAGDFVVPLLVGGTQGIMVGNLVADEFKGLGADWPLGASLAFLVMGVMVGLYQLVTRAVRSVTRW